MKNYDPVRENFSEFYEKWVWKLEEIFHQLLEVSRKRNEMSEAEMQALVNRVTSHVKEYYTVKWGLAHQDVLVFFSPTWLSPLENAYSWITGWKPSAIFRLLLKKGHDQKIMFDMTEEQQRKVEGLRVRIKMEEEKVEREMERHQVALADPKMLELAKLCSRARNGGGGGGDDAVARVDGYVEVALKGVVAGLEKVMKASDCVRLKALKGVLDLLGPMQCVEFLAAFIAMQLRLRQCGKKRSEMDAGSIK